MNGVGIVDDGNAFGYHGGHNHGDDSPDNIRGVEDCSGEFVAAGGQNTMGIAHDDVGSHFDEFRSPKKTGFIHPIVKHDLAGGGGQSQRNEKGKHIYRKSRPWLGPDDKGRCGFSENGFLAGSNDGCGVLVGNVNAKLAKFPIDSGGKLGEGVLDFDFASCKGA